MKASFSHCRKAQYAVYKLWNTEINRNCNEVSCWRKRVSGILFLFALISSFLFICSDSQGAVFSIKPTISFAEEYDDNIFLLNENKKDDFITRVSPSVNIIYQTPLWDWALDYTLFWRYYSKLGQGKDSHYANLTSKMNLVNNFLFLDLKDAYENVVLDPRRPYADQNLDVNKTDSNTLTASPYITYPLKQGLTLTTGYRYTNIWYREGVGINRQMHTAFASLEHPFNANLTGSVYAEYTADRPEKTEPNNDQTSASIKIAYAMNPRTSFAGSVGYRSISFSGGDSKDRLIYDAGLTYNFYENGKIELKANSAFIDSPMFGVYESRMEQVTVTYGAPIELNGGVFHRRDSYFEDIEGNRTDEAFGVTGGLEYKTTGRMTYRASGSYERNRYLPQDQERKIFIAGLDVNYKLAPKATIGVYYHYVRSTGDIEIDSYTDNVVGLQLRMEL